MKQILLAGFSDFAGSMLASSVSCAMKVRGIAVKTLPKNVLCEIELIAEL